MKYTSLVIIILMLSCRSEHAKIEDSPPKTITKQEIITAIGNEERMRIDSVGILIYDGFFDLDAFGPHAALSSMVGTKVFFIAEKKGTVTSSSGVEIIANCEIDEIQRLDILLIPGGTSGTVEASKNENILEWIKEIHATSTFTASVCTGAWILGEAGLLEGKKATTNWYRAKEKIESYKGQFVEDRWVQDGKIWTSAGVSAGIDMGLAMVNEIKGPTYTQLVMLNLEYDPKPPFDGGSVKNTNPGIVNYMTEMYDGILVTETPE